MVDPLMSVRTLESIAFVLVILKFEGMDKLRRRSEDRALIPRFCVIIVTIEGFECI
jgi:hypothetical protein